ncbi:hypothetical protein H8B08_07395 [Caulobacter sp. 17J80-11]|nr:hypothetical protein [Caulobacter sp. 17J80-11]MBC6981571.1 hypothetical protein [Caulobacter sp. 17J80-11]
MAGQVHYEVFARRTPQAPWTLQGATEDRAHALQTAEELMAEGRVAAVRVTKETLDPETMEFASVTLMSKGAPDTRRRRAAAEARTEPACTGVADLYQAHGRETIARLLDDWLRRHKVTAFELMHRPDLAERLEATGMELRHAVQKISVPESQATGRPVHEIMREYERLGAQAIERVIQARRQAQFPSLATESLSAVARRLASHPDRAFLLGGALAADLAPLETWGAKVDRLLDRMDEAPDEPQPRALCFMVVEQMLCEILGSRGGLADLLGADLDLGASLAALTRLAAGPEVELLARHDPSVSRMLPPLEGPAARLGRRVAAGDLKILAGSVARRVVRELNGPRRLRPGDADGEIDILRALAMALTAATGRLLSQDEVQTAFVERSRALVAPDFVTVYLGQGRGGLAEAEALLRLCENVAGAANKRAASRWLAANVAALRFETELRGGAAAPTAKLAALAGLQRAAARADLSEKDLEEITTKLGEVGGLIEADAKLVAQIVRAPAPALQRLSILLKLAGGQTGPSGPVAERAKVEAMKLVRTPEVRAELAAAPERTAEMRPLLQAIGLAA